nr:MAG TPA: hypothetical protein [Caudoviricetes sp.]DAT17501.1 MAG TPA: hypothetical protein [Caudoviricetes sp.]DAX38550.1 MAG TPA: hypothetical protein [Caudoviricetes sp.]
MPMGTKQSCIEILLELRITITISYLIWSIKMEE